MKLLWNGCFWMLCYGLICSACGPAKSDAKNKIQDSKINTNQASHGIESGPQIDETKAIELARHVLSTNKAWSGTGVTYRVTATDEGFRVMVENSDDLDAGNYRVIILDKHGQLIRNTGGL